MIEFVIGFHLLNLCFVAVVSRRFQSDEPV